MHNKRISRTRRFCLPLAASLAVPLQALADWGENWGEMIWGQSAPMVPSLEGVGLGLLVISLVGAAAWRVRRHSAIASLLLVALAIPLGAAAGTLSVPNSFDNGTTADANEVNANFNAVKVAVDDNDAAASMAQSTADAAATAAANAQTAAGAAASAAQMAAQSYADGVASAAQTAAQSYADGAASAAQMAAESYAASAANAAQAAAESYAVSAANAAQAAAESYADGVASAAQTAAQSHANGAASAAQTAAQSYADGTASAAQTAAESYTDTQIFELQAALQMFLTTEACPAGYNAVENGYIKLGATGLTTTASSRTLANPGHGHSHSLENDSYGGHLGNGTQGLGGDGDDLSLNFPLVTHGAHNHSITGSIGAAGVAGDTPQDITGDLEHVTLRLCVRSS